MMIARGLLRSTVLVLAGTMVMAVPARAADQVTLALPSVNISFTALYLAEDMNLWGDQGLQVKTIVIPGVGTNNAVINGSVQFAIGSSDAITRGWAHGQHMQAIGAGVKKTMEWVMIRKDVAEAAHFDPTAPLAERAKILKGKKIAVTSIGSLPDAVLRSVANEADIHADDMSIATMLPPEIMAAWKTKQIDGFSNAMPYAQQVMADGSAMMVSDPTKGEPTKYFPIAASIVTVRADYCPAHKEVCTKFMDGMVAGMKIVVSDREKTMAEMKKRFPAYDDTVLGMAYDALKAAENLPPRVDPAAIENGDRMNIGAGFMKADEKLKDYAPLIDNSYIR
ncbi:MAG TPA: ABC transporter substrate-binding protein [Stellaceae bacterium]|jgi:ABC-type nitrate/sulfonate/bicarbonate transport system substrate-binding protein|nr:ABC transporter substrate-binding protein [Stellaceae bacterium]